MLVDASIFLKKIKNKKSESHSQYIINYLIAIFKLFFVRINYKEVKDASKYKEEEKDS